ncbi:hypothetical protein [Lacticaseibacillus hulanensis]|uniref:hypothetical protein n=1 Tax=Lacticaseibacillus hulanensis TaxID=2493111 RepID=UPI000FD6E407|nr:hypothetical protein [Lacticaseibacillus hulanensis]
MNYLQLNQSDGMLLTALIISGGALYFAQVFTWWVYLVIIVALIITFYAGKLATKEQAKKSRY